MASLHLVRSSEAVTVSIHNPEPVTPMRTVEHQQLMATVEHEQLMDQQYRAYMDGELTLEELEDYYR